MILRHKNAYVEETTGEIVATGQNPEYNLQVPLYPNTVLWFGCHEGKTIAEVIQKNPSYIEWMRLKGFQLTLGALEMFRKRKDDAMVARPGEQQKLWR